MLPFQGVNGAHEGGTLIIRFAEPIRLPAAEIYSYFQSPADWVRLYGFAGPVVDRGNGWYAVPLKRFPFPLVARINAAEPCRLVRWEFKGFWAGGGEVRLLEQPGAVLVEGYEDIRPRRLPLIAPLLERLFLERAFRGIWASGWRRLRRREPDAADAPRDAEARQTLHT